MAYLEGHFLGIRRGVEIHYEAVTFFITFTNVFLNFCHVFTFLTFFIIFIWTFFTSMAFAAHERNYPTSGPVSTGMKPWTRTLSSRTNHHAKSGARWRSMTTADLYRSAFFYKKPQTRRATVGYEEKKKVLRWRLKVDRIRLMVLRLSGRKSVPRTWPDRHGEVQFATTSRA